MVIETKCAKCGSLVRADEGVLRLHNTPHFDARAGRCAARCACGASDPVDANGWHHGGLAAPCALLRSPKAVR